MRWNSLAHGLLIAFAMHLAGGGGNVAPAMAETKVCAKVQVGATSCEGSNDSIPFAMACTRTTYVNGTLTKTETVKKTGEASNWSQGTDMCGKVAANLFQTCKKSGSGCQVIPDTQPSGATKCNQGGTVGTCEGSGASQ